MVFLAFLLSACAPSWSSSRPSFLENPYADDISYQQRVLCSIHPRTC